MAVTSRKRGGSASCRGAATPLQSARPRSRQSSHSAGPVARSTRTVPQRRKRQRGSAPRNEAAGPPRRTAHMRQRRRAAGLTSGRRACGRADAAPSRSRHPAAPTERRWDCEARRRTPLVRSPRSRLCQSSCLLPFGRLSCTRIPPRYHIPGAVLVGRLHDDREKSASVGHSYHQLTPPDLVAEEPRTVPRNLERIVRRNPVPGKLVLRVGGDPQLVDVPSCHYRPRALSSVYDVYAVYTSRKKVA